MWGFLFFGYGFVRSMVQGVDKLLLLLLLLLLYLIQILSLGRRIDIPFRV